MYPHETALRERGKAFGIASLIVAVIPALAWFPLNLGAAGLSIVLSVLAILHGERVYAVIAPVVIGAVLLFLSPVTMALILGQAYIGNPMPLLLLLAFLAAPFGAIAYDNSRRSGGLGSAGAGPSDILKTLENFAQRLTPAGPASGPSQSLVLQASGLSFRVDYREMQYGRTITLGRTASSDVVLRDNSVSRQHARIAIVEGLGVSICDLGSVNGTFADGRRVGGKYVPLNGVKTLRLGSCDVAVALPEDPGGRQERRL